MNLGGWAVALNVWLKFTLFLYKLCVHVMNVWEKKIREKKERKREQRGSVRDPLWGSPPHQCFCAGDVLVMYGWVVCVQELIKMC